MENANIMVEIIEKNHGFPNNERFPVLVYPPDVLKLSGPESFEVVFKRNNWKNSWRNGIFGVHHFHSITHEALGVYQGEVLVQLGGPGGKKFKLVKGQVVVIPAGVAHKNLESNGNFACVGAYPGGSSWDMKYGDKNELPEVRSNISQVGIPDKDPLYGKGGPIFDYWKNV